MQQLTCSGDARPDGLRSDQCHLLSLLWRRWWPIYWHS